MIWDIYIYERTRETDNKEQEINWMRRWKQNENKYDGDIINNNNNNNLIIIRTTRELIEWIQT